MLLHGKNLIVNADEFPIACATGCSYTMTQDFIETCSPTDGYANSYIPTTYGWEVQVDGLVSTDINPFDDRSFLNAITYAFAQRKPLTLQWFDAPDMTTQHRGKAYIEKLAVRSQNKGIVKYSATFKGTGALDSEVKISEQWSIPNGLQTIESKGSLTYEGVNTNIGIAVSHHFVTNENKLLVANNMVMKTAVFTLTATCTRVVTSISDSFNADSNVLKLYPSRYIVLNQLTHDQIATIINYNGADGYYPDFISPNCIIDPGPFGHPRALLNRGNTYTVLLTMDSSADGHDGYLALIG